MPALTPEAFLLPLALLWVAGAEGLFLPPWVAWVTGTVLGGLAWRRLIHGVRVGPAFAWLLGFIWWLAFSAVWQPVPRDRAAHLVAMGVFAGVLALIVAHPRGRRWLLLGVVAAGLLCSLWMVVERLCVPGRPGGPFGNPNGAASLVVLAFAFWGPRGGVLGGVCLPVLLLGVVASGSRAAMLSVVVASLYWMQLRLSRQWKVTVVFGAAAALLGLVFRVFFDPDPLRFERVRIWKSALATAWATFPWGTGPGGFADAVLARNFPRIGEFARYHRIPDLAENDFLQLLASLGIVGFILGLGLLWSTGRALARRRPGNFSPLLALTVMGLFHSQLLWPVVALPAVAVGRFSGRWRLRLGWPGALVVLWPLILWASVALPWPSGGLGRDLQDARQRIEKVLREKTSLEELARALVEAESIARQVRRSGQDWRALARVQLRLARVTGDGRAAEASVTSFRRAQELNPKDVWSFLGEAEAWVLLGEWEPAGRAAQRALQLEPNCVPCWLTLAETQLFLGMQGAARGSFQNALAAERKARAWPMVTAYERSLATPDPLLRARLNAALGGKP